MSRKKISDYVQYPTSIVDGRKIVGNLTKQAIADPDKPGYVKEYRDRITLDRSPVNVSLSKNSPKYKQKSVKQYDPGILDQRSRIHSKKYGSRYTLILDCSEVWIELSQIGKNDDQVRLIRLGSADHNSCFIPDMDVNFEGKIIDFSILCEYIGVSVKSLLNQCKAIALKYKPLKDRISDNSYQLERKKLVKKTQIR